MGTYDSFGATARELPERAETQLDQDSRTQMSLEASSVYKERANPPASQYRNSWVYDLLDSGTYKVEKGDSLALVARRALGVSGHADASSREIAAEVKRIAALNGLEVDSKGRLRGVLSADTVLNIGRKSEAFSAAGKVVEAQPSARKRETVDRAHQNAPGKSQVEGCAEDRPRVLVSQGVARAGMCDRMDVSDSAFVTVRPGADVIVRTGARAFVFGGNVVGEANSRIFAAGGEIQARPGASIKFIGSEAKVIQLADVEPALPARQTTDSELL